MTTLAPRFPQASLRAALAALAALAAGAAAQGARADYDRAAALRERFSGKVFRESVRPRWLPGGNEFWYRAATGPGTHEFVFVDALKGIRRPAFDHARMAAALARAGIADAKAEALPLDGLGQRLAAGAVTFRAGGAWWRCDTATFECETFTPSPRALAADRGRRAPRATRHTGAETSVTFINATGGEIELFWLDPEGRRRSYGKIAPGARRDQHTFAGHVWLVVDAAGAPLLRLEAEEEAFSVSVEPLAAGAEPPAPRPRPGRLGASPDGTLEAFIKDHNIWLRDPVTREESALSADGAPGEAYGERFAWSPDGRHIAAIRVVSGDDRKVFVIESSPRDQLQPKLRSYPYLKPGDRVPLHQVRLFDVAARAPIAVPDALFANPWDITGLHWAPDSSFFTFLYNQRGHQVLRVIAVDAATGAARVVIEEKSPTFVDYAGKFFLHYLDAAGEIIWMSERDGWNHLYLYDGAGGGVKNQITQGAWVVRGVERVDAEARRIIFRAGGIVPGQDPYYLHTCAVNFDGSGLAVLTEGDGTHAVEFSPDGRFLIDAWSRVDLPPVTELRRAADGGRVCELERADHRALLAAGWRAPERFNAKGRDGATDIYGVIHRPTTFDPKGKYPIIEAIYAGPQDSFVPKAFRSHFDAQSMAELGFIVVQIDGMGTSNRSKQFHDVCWRNLADAGLPDRVLWIKAAAATRPYMDLARVGIYGGSAGGQSALGALLTHGDFYHAAVADCGCHDNRMDKIWWNELWMGWPVGPHYAENSNVTLAHKLRGKLLLIVGELDDNVDPASTMQVVRALIDADKDFELLVIPGAGHGAAGTPYGHRRLQDFFVRNLLGVEPRRGPDA